MHILLMVDMNPPRRGGVLNGSTPNVVQGSLIK